MDLWEKGYYLIFGVKFGGDLLVYFGDLFRYYLYYIVIIVLWGKKIILFDMILVGRLGVIVKKIVFICFVNDEIDEILYIFIKWSGIS